MTKFWEVVYNHPSRQAKLQTKLTADTYRGALDHVSFLMKAKPGSHVIVTKVTRDSTLFEKLSDVASALADL